jgi:hypothetical protein
MAPRMFGKTCPATKSSSWRFAWAAGLPGLLVVRSCPPVHSDTGLEHGPDRCPVPALRLAIGASWRSAEAGGATITVINLAIIIGPVTWLGFGLVDGLQGLAGQLGAGTLAIPSPPEGVKDWPIVGTQIYALWDHASTNLRAALRELAPHLKPLAGPVLAFVDAGSAACCSWTSCASAATSTGNMSRRRRRMS